MKHLILLLSFIILSTPAFAEDTNYCNDKESWKEWNELAKKYPKDIPLQIMHALRIGLCNKIEQGTITYEETVFLMNNMMENLKAKIGDQELPEKKEKEFWIQMIAFVSKDENLTKAHILEG